ncbi:tyrosine-type recombinase/integrase [Streptomonospora halotolerans]|nr:tyrosine-type recombinase/integrase [Streptomonospora nanhaiensis]
MAGTRVRRGPRNMDAGSLKFHINSFSLALRAQKLSKRTVTMYCEAVAWFAAEHLIAGGQLNEIDRRHHTGGENPPPFDPVDNWEHVTRYHVETWCVRLLNRGHADSYVNNQYRCLHAFFQWLSEEEEIPNPMGRMKPPKVALKPVPVFSDEEIDRLFGQFKGKDLWTRRDHALLLLLRFTGIRLMEAAALRIEDLDLGERVALVHGKGSKDRTVKYTFETARALDRYIRARSRHRFSYLPHLWIGPKGSLTSSGIYQLVERRAAQVGLEGVHPHRFRHHFSHTWLENGGAEGDLRELNGWESDQMLRHYGRSAAAARARRGYDRIMEDMH